MYVPDSYHFKFGTIRSLDKLLLSLWFEILHFLLFFFCFFFFVLLSETYLEPRRKSKIGYFAKIVKAWKCQLVPAIFYQIFIFRQMIALQKLWKKFLFHLKSFFRSQDIFLFPYSPFFFSLSAFALKVHSKA